MMAIRQAWLVRGVGFVLAGILAACAAEPGERLRSVQPRDLLAYRSAIEEQRAHKEQSFRTDEGSPILQEDLPGWKGLRHYPVDPSYRLEGPLIRKALPDSFTIISTSGAQRPVREIGFFRLDLGAGVETLPVYELLDSPDDGSSRLFLPFMDATTEIESYPAGRYVEPMELERGRYLVDFNLAYNPLCAYGGSWNCPITPERNRLKASVRAGEWDYRYR